MNETQIRERLQAVADDAPTPTTVPRTMLRRARRRLALNAAVAGLVGLGLVAGGLAAVRMIQARPIPADRPSPPPSSHGKLAYALEGDIYVADWDGSNAVPIADGSSVSECDGMGVYWADGPMWSPDGRYLAYRQNCPSRPESTSGVVISDPEGNVVAEFPGTEFSGGPSGRIAWSPDSTRFATWVDYGETIGVFGVDGTQQALLSVPPLESAPVDPRWLPDGRSLLVPPRVVVPLDGSEPYRLPSDDPRAGWYSPDGSRVAYLTGGADNSLVVADADGSNAEVVFDGQVIVGSPDVVWSPTSDRIAFTSNRAGSTTISGFELRVVDLATGTVTLLAEASTDVLLSVIDFSPDGERILFSRPQGIGSLWSVEVDGSDPRRLFSGTAWGDWQPRAPMP